MLLTEAVRHLFVLDYTLKIVILGTSILGAVSGTVGAFATLRKQSLLGDAISHAALPGICIMFLLTQTKSTLWLLVGALIAGWVGTWIMTLVVTQTKLKQDAALGVILSVFFGFGLMLLTLIQKIPNANQAGLHKYLFGNASTLLKHDVLMMSVLSVIVLSAIFMFWKEFKLLTFDRDYAFSLGFSTVKLDLLLVSLTVCGIVLGLQTVGVVLMSAMLIAPAVAARQWTNSLSKMVMISATMGALSGSIGAVISSSIDHLPTGPTIVLVMSVMVLISLGFAPERGLFMQRKKQNASN